MKFIKSNQFTNDRKVLFLSAPEDTKYLKDLSIDILRIDEVEIYYIEDNDYNIDELLLSNFLLVFYPITRNLLKNKGLIKFIKEINNNGTAMLPIMVEPALDKYFNEYIGEYEFINKISESSTEIPYAEKLSNFIKSVIADNDLTNKILKNYTNKIFLSYRKKDREELNNLIKIIREESELDLSSIWYDEFLTLGEEYNQIINDQIQNCDVFIMLITSNILEEDNYVYKNEYPFAVELNKKIIGYLTKPLTEEEQIKFNKMYPTINCIYDNTTINKALMDICLNNKNYDSYLLALGKLYGIGTLKNVNQAIEILNNLAENNNNDAIEKLIELYADGKLINKDFNKISDLLNRQIEKYEVQEYYIDNLELKEKMRDLFLVETCFSDDETLGETFDKLTSLMIDKSCLYYEQNDIYKIISYFKIKNKEDLSIVLKDFSDLLFLYVRKYILHNKMPTYSLNFTYLSLTSLLYLSTNYNDLEAAKELQSKIKFVSNIWPVTIPTSFLIELTNKIKKNISDSEYYESILSILFRYEKDDFSEKDKILMETELLKLISSLENKTDFESLNTLLQAYDILNKDKKYNDKIEQVAKKIKSLGDDEYYNKISIKPVSDINYYQNQYDYLKKLAKVNGYYLYEFNMENALFYLKSEKYVDIDRLNILKETIDFYEKVYSEFNDVKALINQEEAYLDLLEFYLEREDKKSAKQTWLMALLYISIILDYTDESKIYNTLSRLYSLNFRMEEKEEDKIESVNNYLYYTKQNLDENDGFYRIRVEMFLEEVYKFLNYSFEIKNYELFLKCLYNYLQYNYKYSEKSNGLVLIEYNDVIKKAIYVLNHERNVKRKIIDKNFVNYLKNHNDDVNFYLYKIYLFLLQYYINNNKLLKSKIVKKYFVKHKNLIE